MHIVHVKPHENIDFALKRLKQKMDRDYVLEEVRSKRYFETSGQKHKRKEKALSRKIKLKR